MSRYLRSIRADRYGGLVDCGLGPFGPGLNVVYGPNETGKSTFASLVGGVLFGWDDAHGVRNTYRPGEGGRAGALSWAETSDSPDRPDSSDSLDGPAATLRRIEEGVVGDSSVLDDIDRNTFETVFSLTSDELRSLKGSSDVAARLFTAGAGASSSPSDVFVEIEQRIAGSPVYRLEEELEEKLEQVREASEQARLRIQEDRELRELKAGRASTAERVSALDDELEILYSQRAELEAINGRVDRLVAERNGLAEERAVLADERPEEAAVDRRLLELDSAGDRVLRDRLDELGELQEKVGRALDIAKENSSTSTASYEALCELDDEDEVARRRLRNRTTQTAVSVLLPLAFILAGVPLFVHGRQINSLSFTALGVGLVVFAVLLAVAALVVLFRRPAGAETLESRRKDAQWVMLQDRKKLDSCKAEQAEVERRVSEFLDASGLTRADGSIRRARSLLDEARELRSARAENEQKASSLDLRIRAIEKELAELAAARSRVTSSLAGAQGGAGFARLSAVDGGQGSLADDAAAFPGRESSAAVGALIKEKARQREALIEASEGMSRRFGELEHDLAGARNDRSFDQAKFEYQQIRARLRVAKRELISLLLAKRMLERSIVMWESQGQPEVNARAGRLLSTITDGRWVEVATSSTGSLVAIGSDGVARDPRHLSLGTCQQLYLALRIALLITAEGVGRDIPVLADDILVHFDSTRRRGAARALAELAGYRQVIVFTCHEETARALTETAPGCTRIDLYNGRAD